MRITEEGERSYRAGLMDAKHGRPSQETWHECCESYLAGYSKGCSMWTYEQRHALFQA